MKRVRAIGYPAVQISGIGPIPVADINSILAGENLVCCATHEPPAQILQNPSAVVERLQALGCKHTAYPYPADIDFGSEAAVEKLIRELDASGAVLHEAGLTLSYHNHAHEFRKLGDSTILEAIYAKTNPENLRAELDTYWIQYGGANPTAWVEEMAGRMPLLHLKDFAVNAENQPMIAEVGSGNIDFASVVAAAEKGGCEWFIVEQDSCPGDPFDSIQKSFDYIQTLFIS